MLAGWGEVVGRWDFRRWKRMFLYPIFSIHTIRFLPGSSLKQTFQTHDRLNIAWHSHCDIHETIVNYISRRIISRKGILAMANRIYRSSEKIYQIQHLILTANQPMSQARSLLFFKKEGFCFVCPRPSGDARARFGNRRDANRLNFYGKK